MRGGSLTARIAVALVALAAIAWLGVSYRNAHLTADAKAVADREKPSPAAVEQALRDLDRAGRLNPDRSEAGALAVVLQFRAGRLDRAREELERLVRDEPANAEAWLLLASLTRESDPERSAQARERLRKLNPLDPGSPAK